MRILVREDEEAVSAAAADVVAEIVRDRPRCAVVAATGASPLGLYRRLAQYYASNDLDTTGLRVFQLDEYVGLGPEDRRSLFLWMQAVLLRPLAIPAERTVRLHADARDLEAECRTYEHAARAAGGFDLAILGLGLNGHLGFNEPPSDPLSPTRVVTLTPESVRSNAAYWGGEEQVPGRALTAGMDLLLGSRTVLLIVTGAHKAGILARSVCGPRTQKVPASFLQSVPNVIVIADRAAAGSLPAS